MSAAGTGAGPGILFVCTGNICRSPAAELLFRARTVGRAVGIDVSSAGLRARTGEPAAPPTAALLRALGVDPAGFRAQQFLPSSVGPATVVLTMTAAQRTDAVARVPAAVRRTFTLREFVALARLTQLAPERDPARRLAALVAGAGRARARRGPAGDDDIPDPYGRPEEVHARVLAVLEAAVTDLVAVLTDHAADSP